MRTNLFIVEVIQSQNSLYVLALIETGGLLDYRQNYRYLYVALYAIFYNSYTKPYSMILAFYLVSFNDDVFGDITILTGEKEIKANASTNLAPITLLNLFYSRANMFTSINI